LNTARKVCTIEEWRPEAEAPALLWLGFLQRGGIFRDLSNGLFKDIECVHVEGRNPWRIMLHWVRVNTIPVMECRLADNFARWQVTPPLLFNPKAMG
jgi:hypothetical protein